MWYWQKDFNVTECIINNLANFPIFCITNEGFGVIKTSIKTKSFAKNTQIYIPVYRDFIVSLNQSMPLDLDNHYHGHCHYCSKQKCGRLSSSSPSKCESKQLSLITNTSWAYGPLSFTPHLPGILNFLSRDQMAARVCETFDIWTPILRGPSAMGFTLDNTLCVTSAPVGHSVTPGNIGPL